ncbi:LacI family DNA-binding transcriptional regulator [Companilactobacillus sp. HBUAS59544]|uniref:LacI family DNA-binding transcriptional regulator n=1 Tax=Companilactobacillus sp. HBUAS59544 TaxID=3109363 RepID=UPI002FEFA1ED
MSTLKDVAKLAGVSVSTVSIVVNGTTKERKIPDSTVQKVQAAIKKLGYRPNRSARQLRLLDKQEKEIAFFWALDKRTSSLSSLLLGLQAQIVKLNLNWRIVIQTYQDNHLDLAIKNLENGYYDGAIIGATSLEDLIKLEKNDNIQVPLILINRTSKKYSTVNVDPNSVAQMTVTLLMAMNFNSMNIVSNSQYLASSQRINALKKIASQNHIKIKNTFKVDNTYDAGIKFAKNSLNDLPTSTPFIIESDAVAIGMVYFYNRNNIKIPRDLKLISMGTSDEKITKYSTPSITTIKTPNKDMSANCINLMNILLNQNDKPQHLIVEPKLNLRESFPTNN